MLFANIRELKLETNKLLNLSLQRGPVVITRRGKPVAILRGIEKESNTFFTYREVLDKIRRAAEKAGYGPRDIEGLITRVRKETYGTT